MSEPNAYSRAPRPIPPDDYDYGFAEGREVGRAEGREAGFSRGTLVGTAIAFLTMVLTRLFFLWLDSQ